MSSILTALKKLEDENMARKSAPHRIDAEILRSCSSKRISTFRGILLAMILFSGGGGATYLYLKNNSRPPQAPAEAPHTNSPSITLTTPPMPIERILTEHIVAAKTDEHVKHNSAVSSKKTPYPQKLQPTPKILTKPRLPTLKVNGIAFQDGSDSVAVVNNIPVSKGSVIEGIRVDEIWRDRVQFSNGEEKFDIYLGKSSR